MEYQLKDGTTVIVRGIQVEDAELVLDYMTKVNSETKNLTRDPDEFNMTLEQEQKFIERVVHSKDEYVYTVWNGDELISVTGIHGNSLRRSKHKVTLGISILMKYHNLGLGSKLMELLVEKARELGKTKMELDVRSDNPNAIRIYEKVGFEVEGIRKNGFYVDDKYVDLVLMGRIL